MHPEIKSKARLEIVCREGERQEDMVGVGEFQRCLEFNTGEG